MIRVDLLQDEWELIVALVGESDRAYMVKHAIGEIKNHIYSQGH